MGDDDQDALIEALRPFVERYGRERIEQALRQISPRARGRPKYSDDQLMLEAFYLWQTGRFYGEPDSACEPVKSTHAALRRTVEKFWSKRLGASKEAVLRRLWTRFKKTPFEPAALKATEEDFRDEIERLEAEQAAFLADLLEEVDDKSSSWPGWRPPLK